MCTCQLYISQRKLLLKSAIRSVRKSKNYLSFPQVSSPSRILTWPLGREQPGSSLFYRRACHIRNSFPPCKLLAKTTEASRPGTDIQYPACDNRDGADNLAAEDTKHHYILFKVRHVAEQQIADISHVTKGIFLCDTGSLFPVHLEHVILQGIVNISCYPLTILSNTSLLPEN